MRKILLHKGHFIFKTFPFIIFRRFFFFFIYLQSTVCTLMTWKEKRDEWRIFVWEKRNYDMNGNLKNFSILLTSNRLLCMVFFFDMDLCTIHQLGGCLKGKIPDLFWDVETFFFVRFNLISCHSILFCC